MILCEQPAISLSNINELAILITIVGYVVVFVSLAILVIIIGRISIIQRVLIKMKLKNLRKHFHKEEVLPEISISADENAAIGTALYLFFSDKHDEEKYVMTVKKVSRTYSPWSSKIYGVFKIDNRG